MKLNEEELDILINIREGNSDTHQLRVFSSVKDLNKLKIILNKLEEKLVIKIKKKYDNAYKEDYWESEITRKGKTLIKEK